MTKPFLSSTALFAGLLATTLTAAAPPARDDIVAVRIELTSYGLQGRASETWDIARVGDGFERHGVAIREPRSGAPAIRTPFAAQPVAAARVAALAAAVDAPPMTRRQGIDRLTTAARLADSVDAAYATQFSADFPPCSPEARALFVDEYTDPRAAAWAAEQYYDSRWTDDYPRATVTITYAGGRSAELVSGSQHALMLPWRGAQPTWDPALPDAIAALLPEPSTHRERLAADAWIDALADEAMQSVEDAWEDAELRCRHASVIAALDGDFDVVRAFHGFPGTFSATLTRDDLPPNLVLTVHLPGDDSSASNARFAEFLLEIAAYIEIARPFVAARPAERFALWYSRGASFDFAEHEVFGDDDAVPRLRGHPARDRGVLLREQGVPRGREWVVLPGGDALTWKEAAGY